MKPVDPASFQSTVIDFDTFFGTSGWTPWSATRSASSLSILMADMRNASHCSTMVAEKTKRSRSPVGGVSMRKER